MKNFIVFALVALLSANAFAAAALSGSCHGSHDGGPSQVLDIEPANAPCHEQGDAVTPEQPNHCEGACLCVHASFQNTPMLEGLPAIEFAALGKARINTAQQDFASLIPSPPRRPPKAPS